MEGNKYKFQCIQCQKTFDAIIDWENSSYEKGTMDYVLTENGQEEIIHFVKENPVNQKLENLFFHNSHCCVEWLTKHGYTEDVEKYFVETQ